MGSYSSLLNNVPSRCHGKPWDGSRRQRTICLDARGALSDTLDASIIDIYRCHSARSCHSLRPVAEELLDPMLIRVQDTFCVEKLQKWSKHGGDAMEMIAQSDHANSCRGPKVHTKPRVDVIREVSVACCKLAGSKSLQASFGHPINADPGKLPAHCAIQVSILSKTSVEESESRVRPHVRAKYEGTLGAVHSAWLMERSRQCRRYARPTCATFQETPADDLTDPSGSIVQTVRLLRGVKWGWKSYNSSAAALFPVVNARILHC